ncbi:hypothetical protein D9619_009139 [Psilocybe cf. subviscida]|uniref:Uncharacterized protein n=1 Tax=Psilocybe cf. subviscida TaxID=2480587 RepID=A0A8H5BUF4_9AGAR|nr:hypothetical protein D9619_009139 [Psilocybe cf. subviscida]
MDPLSVTLAVVTLATAVKDLAELGQKIHESFAKVSKNLRNAQRLAGNIKEMVNEINTFCEDHQDVLANMKDFCMALQGLLVKFRGFEASILPLLPKTGRRKLGPFIRGWWNNNKIQDCISDLEIDVVKVMRGYMMKNAMRTEVKLERIHQETSRGLSSITAGLEVLEVVRRDVSALRTTTASTITHGLYESSGTTSNDFNHNVIMFAQSTLSTSAPMLRTPNVITEELMTAAYIKLQINNIAVIVEKMSMPPASATTNAASFSFTPVLEQASMSVTQLRHHVVRQVITVRDLLDTPCNHTVSIEDGARALSMLAIALRTLGMDHESILLGNWAIMLFRALVDASGGRHAQWRARLALYLCNQSVRDGDKKQSLQTIGEALTIAQDLRNQNREDTHFQILHSEILFQYARLADNQQSIEMSIKGIQVLEDIFNVRAFTLADGEIQSVVQPTSSFFDCLFSLAPPISAIIDYACSLQNLGIYISRNGPSWHQSTLALGRLALALRQKIVAIHGHVHKAGLADTLLMLVQSAAARCIPIEELVEIADECIQILRELAENNPLYYARKLVGALQVKATTLEKLGQDTEAVATWEEVVNLAGQIVQDSELCAHLLGHLSNQFRRLKRYDDAVRTGMLAITTHHGQAETRAWRYFYMSEDLRQLCSYKQSAEAAQTSVALFRHLAIRNYKKWKYGLMEGLSNLAYCLTALGDYSEALVAWKESASMVDNFLDTNTGGASSCVIDRCCATLFIHLRTSLILKDEEECLKVCSTAVQYLRQVLEIYPQNKHVNLHLFSAQFYHAHNMIRVGRPQDVQQCVDHWFDIWCSKAEPISGSEMASWQALMLTLKVNALDAQGSTKQALLAAQKVRGIVRSSVSDNQLCFSAMIWSMAYEAQQQTALGNCEEALQVAEEALRLARDNKLKPTIENLVWSLYAVGFTALTCRNYKRAVKAAQEGCDVLASPKDLKSWQDSDWRERRVFIHPSLFAILSSAEANLGRCNIALEHAHRAVDASQKMGEMKADISATTAERSYMETRGNLAEILLTTGDLSQAQEICEERSAYYSQRVEKRMGEYRDLAPILSMLGILCCSEGHHEKGEAAAQELSRIMKTLGSAFPSLQEQVKLRLRNQAQVPILKALNDMGQKLNCGHQKEVASFAAI